MRTGLPPFHDSTIPWTLVLAGLHDEARKVLERAAALAPEHYTLPRKNLLELEKRMNAGKLE